MNGTEHNHEMIEHAIDARLAQWSKAWAAVSAPDTLHRLILSTIQAETATARERVRAFIEQLAARRDLLSEILANPADRLPGCLARFQIHLTDFAAELQHMKSEYHAEANRELTDDELVGVIGGASSGDLSLYEIEQMLIHIETLTNGTTL